MAALKNYTTMTFLNVKSMINTFNTIDLSKFNQSKSCYLHFSAQAYYVVEIKVENVTYLPDIMNNISGIYPNNACCLELPNT